MLFFQTLNFDLQACNCRKRSSLSILIFSNSSTLLSKTDFILLSSSYKDSVSFKPANTVQGCSSLFKFKVGATAMLLSIVFVCVGKVRLVSVRLRFLSSFLPLLSNIGKTKCLTIYAASSGVTWLSCRVFYAGNVLVASVFPSLEIVSVLKKLFRVRFPLSVAKEFSLR